MKIEITQEKETRIIDDFYVYTPLSKMLYLPLSYLCFTGINLIQFNMDSIQFEGTERVPSGTGYLGPLTQIRIYFQ